MKINTNDGIELCKILYNELSNIGYFPALTGGLLYKEGERKDIDIVIYRHRQQNCKFEMKEISTYLISAGITDLKYYGFVTKGKWRGKSVDLFNPETEQGDEEYGQ